MKTRLRILIVFLFLGTIGSFAQYCPVPKPLDLKEAVGEWKGNFTYNGDLKKFTINISETSGKLYSKVSIPGMNTQNVSAFTKICSGEEIHIEIVVNNEKFDFRGKPQKGKMAGKLINRNLKNDTSQEVFSLKRT